ncbi:MAG: serine hydrolase [Anaerolineales bacterium]|nr:serine hydrolase [Chloroflexota bacterium]MBL6980386.1 serine hydrolase [Anaerolineales bacterium]
MTTQKKRHYSLFRFVSMIIILSMLVGCGPSSAELATANYVPLPSDNWNVSTPAEQGLDPNLVAELYLNAAELDTLYGLLVVKNGHLIAEGYFNGGSVEQKAFMASATKSFTSALVGIALDQGCLSSVDQKMIDFFPEFSDQITDPRKKQITILDLLQMRSGYVWEERTPYMDAFFSSRGYWLPFIVEFPLTSNPGTEFGYSNLTSHVLGAIVARSCDTDLKSFAQEHLFSPIDTQVGDWSQDADGYNYGSHGMSLTARDRAKFGLLYLNDGEYDGSQVISADFIEDSLQRYSEKIDISGWMPGITSRYGYYRDIGYGYQWWSARSGDHQFKYASGHGGNQIILLDELDMVIVTSADRLYGNFSGDAWEKERAIIDVVGGFINSLPSE